MVAIRKKDKGITDVKKHTKRLRIMAKKVRTFGVNAGMWPRGEKYRLWRGNMVSEIIYRSLL
jgi:hypothetical protein